MNSITPTVLSTRRLYWQSVIYICTWSYEIQILMVVLSICWLKKVELLEKKRKKKRKKVVWFDFFNINFHGLFNTKVSLVEQQWYFLTHSLGDNGVHTFPNCISLKVNVMWFELAYYNIAVQKSGHRKHWQSNRSEDVWNYLFWVKSQSFIRGDNSPHHMVILMMTTIEIFELAGIWIFTMIFA